MELAGIIIGLITAVCTTGGIIYLIVDRLFTRRKDKAEAVQTGADAKRTTVEYGISMVTIYNEIDKIVESKTRPIQDKLDHALTRIDTLESNWCCYREDCKKRLLRRHDWEVVQKLKSMADDTVCKNQGPADK